MMFQKNKSAQLKEMFQKMVVEKDASQLALYYHPEFLCYTNGKIMTFDDMNTFHQEVYATPIQYAVTYNEDTFVEQNNKLAARIFITTMMPDKKPTEIEVVLIVEYKDDKLYRAWELTFPNWIQMSEFESQI